MWMIYTLMILSFMTLIVIAMYFIYEIMRHKKEGEYTRIGKMEIGTIIKVLENSKNDLNMSGFHHEIEDENLREFLEENEEDIEDYLKYVIPEIMNRLKFRLALAKSEDDTK